MVATRKPQEILPDQRAYHLAEFAKLNAEITELIGSTSRLLNFAAATSGALFAWLLTSKSVNPLLLELGFALPALLTMALGAMAYAQAERINQMGRYLLKLENALGSELLGWQKHFELEGSVVGNATKAAWIILFLAVAIGGVAAARLT